MSLESNLQSGRDAVAAVRSHNIMSSNIASHRIAFAGGIEAAIRSDRPTGMRDRGELGNANRWIRSRGLNRAEYDLSKLLLGARQTIAHRLGNCGELCEIAVEHLYVTGVRPVEIWQFPPNSPTYDHAFIIIGRRAGGATALGSTERVSDWGADAVWCDPWQSGGVVFSIADFIRGSVRNLDFRLKCHTVDSVEAGQPHLIFRLG